VRTTLDVTIHRKSEPIGRRVFSTLVEGPGEPHQWRDDLGVLADSPVAETAPYPLDSHGSEGPGGFGGCGGSGGSAGFGAQDDRLVGARALLRLVHLTDTHVIDASSPARAEYVELAAATDARWDIMVPMFRPHELLQQHALAAMVDTINLLDCAPVSSDPLDVVIVTGDCIDNAQRNELNAYLALLDGGVVQLPYDGVQSVAARVGKETATGLEGKREPGVGVGAEAGAEAEFRAGAGVGTGARAGAGAAISGEIGAEARIEVVGEAGLLIDDSGFWCPDPSVDDHWKRAYGFPSYPGLLEALDEPIVSVGLKLPWLGIVGNHDWLRQGTAKTSAALEAIAVGSEKSTGMPAEFLPEDALIAYLEEPASYNVGASVRSVHADPERVGISAPEFIRAHIDSDNRKARPEVRYRDATRGHGFGDDVNNVRPDYVADFGAVRIIAIDTNHPAGHYQGSVGLAQLAWLEERLIEAKNVYVLLASHHPTEALTNETRAEGFPDDRVLADPVAAVLHRHPCVIGWLTGHRHHHRVKAHRDPLGVSAGFWEITTSSIIDWPSQARILEVLQLADGQIVLASTVLDHHGTIDPGPLAAKSLVGLAGAHREIAAANAVQRGESFLRRAPGRPGDRNVILPVR
jgi:metallophosphoesterase (TIGR03767 family)